MAHAPQYEPGKYLGIVSEQAFSESSKGNKQFILRCKIVGKYDEEGTLCEFPSQRVRDRNIFMTITDKTVDFVIDALRSIGYEGNTFSGLDPQTPGFHNFASHEVPLYCSHEEYNGNWQERWRIDNGSGGGLNVKPLDSKGVRSLDAMFGKALKATAKPAAKPNGSPKPKTIDEANAEIQKEQPADIPF